MHKHMVMAQTLNGTLQATNVSFRKPTSIPTKIGKYEIQEEVGRGTCGIVYKGFDPFVQRDVAIKVGLTELTDDADKSRQYTRDFFVEAHATGKLQHPHIVSLFDAGIEGDYNYLVMEYLEGETLLEYCRYDGRRLSTEKVLDCMFKCCRALEYSHRMSVIHRDIKPSNIMLAEDGTTKLMDFSIAEITHNLLITPEEVIGSPSYMSPEQILKNAVGPQSDLYSLGAVMFQLLTGERPFASADIQEVFNDIVHKPAPLLSELRPDLPLALSEVIDKALSKDPADRFQSGQEFGDQLITIHDQLRQAESKLVRRQDHDQLKQLKFFRGFTDQQVDELLDAASLMTLKAGTAVINEGDIDDSFYIIVRGDVEVRKTDRLVATLYQGDCFGEIGFLRSSKRTATIVAVTDLLLLKVNAMLMETVSPETQLCYYKAFNEALIYRLALTNVRLSNLQQ